MNLISKETIIAVLALYFFSNYKPKYNLFFVLMTMFQTGERILDYANSILSPDYFQINHEVTTDSTNKVENPGKGIETRYEDKYLEQIRKLDTEFHFDDNEEDLKMEKYNEFISTLTSQNTELFLDKLSEIDGKIAKCENKDDEYCISKSDSDSDYQEEDDLELIKTREEQMKLLLEEKTTINSQYDKLKEYLETDESKEMIAKEALELATKYIMNQKIEKLKDCYVMEKTPLGNVLMVYNNERSSFSWYSDSSIPYRYLEVVARKYVKTFACRPIFVDMDEELKKAEDKLLLKKEKEEELKKAADTTQKQGLNLDQIQKKSVFAKFKSYNKDASATKAMIAPPKNSIPNKPITSEQENEGVLLKDNANRYTYEGKLANFNFLKKVERKVFDKKYALTFADFKKIQQK